MSVNWWQTPWTERSLCPALYTRCFHLSCDALRSRAAIISISQVRETEASGSEPQPQAPSGTLVDPLVTPEGFREPGSWMELAHPLCAPPPDMSEGRGRGLGRALASPVLRAQKGSRPAGWLQSLFLAVLLTAATTPSPREKRAQRFRDVTEATQLGADEAGFRGRPSAAGPCRLPQGGRGAGLPRSILTPTSRCFCRPGERLSPGQPSECPLAG